MAEPASWSHLLAGQAGADQLAVVPREHMFVCVRGMRPTDPSALLKLGRRRLDQLGSTDLVEALRGERADDQLAAFVEHPDSVSVPDHMDVAPPSLGHRREVLPDPIAGASVQTAQLKVEGEAKGRDW